MTSSSPPQLADVTVCIPTWQAEAFVDRTLHCARAQTHSAQRIVVSIDQSNDGTEEICRRHAREDGRVDVHVQPERLGWARNVNFLLDRVRTEFAFLYFHDDVIEPTYCERLVDALRSRPDAVSAHCDVSLLHGSDGLGRAYEGSAAERLLTFLVAPQRGPLLRSMLRMDVLGSELRLPTASSAGLYAHEPFVMKLVATGPALRVAERLYHRWDRRQGGLTDSWRSLPFETILQAHRVNAELALRMIDDLDLSSSERDCLLFGLLVYMTRRLRRAEGRHQTQSVNAPGVLHPYFADMNIPRAVRRLPEPLRAWCETAYDDVLRQTGRQALQLGDHALATSSLETLTRRQPTEGQAWTMLAQARRGAGRSRAAGVAERRARRLASGSARRHIWRR